MLGFDALARRALAEIPQGTQNVTLVVASGAYAVTGSATAGLIGTVAQHGSYAVTGYPVGLVGAADHGSYALTGNVIAFSAAFAASAGSYAVTGHAATFAPVEAVASGQYTLTGADAGQRFETGSGSYHVAGALRVVYAGAGGLLGFGAIGGGPLGYSGYPIISDATSFAINFVAESGSYALTLGSYELRRTGYDYAPDQYGIGHIKLAMAEARRLSRVVKPTPQPIVSRPPALRAPAVVPNLPRVNGLIDDTGFMDRLHAKQQEAAAQAEAHSRQQARNRTIAVLLLAA